MSGGCVFISAGEQSGDLHASDLVSSLKELRPGLQFYGLGGEMMAKEGVKLLYSISSLSTIGFTDVVRKFAFFNKVLRECVEFVRSSGCKAVILVDYPGFNLRFAEKLRSVYEGKIIYYISPQLWAWRENRVKKIKRLVDKMLVVFPFEEEFYRKHGISAQYVGHPLVSRLKRFVRDYSPEKGQAGREKHIAILPGSREVELRNHLPALSNLAHDLRKEFNAVISVSKASGPGDAFKDFEKSFEGCEITSRNVYELIVDSDLVLTKAGTSTVECALLGVPFVVFYRTSPVNYYLLRPLVKVNKLAMVNILAGENIVKEFIQKELTTRNLLEEARKILTDSGYRDKMKQNLKKIQSILGEEDASRNAANIIIESALT